MKSCLRVPRILLPEDGFEKWAVIACDQFTSDRDYWRRVEHAVGDAPSTLHFILPEAYLSDGDENTAENVRAAMFRALEQGWVSKLTRGVVLTERTTGSGVRKGILAALDLEEYTTGKDEISTVRSSEEVVPSRLPARVEIRRRAPLEFPHAMVFYKDKKGKVLKTLKGEELEKLYDFDLMEEGGHITGYFVPPDLSLDVLRAMYSKTDPSFAVADGNHSVAAAKALWEEIKPSLSEKERENHPARFTLVELVNLYDEAVVFHPIHRIIKEIEPEVFCDYFMRNAKCKREGNVLSLVKETGASAVKLCDELIERYIKQNGGAVDYIHGENELRALAQGDGVGILLKTVEKDDFFSALENGGNFPKKTFSVGEAREKRYYLEGREISYD